jgi:myo-inositol-1(or 4)-monophosphatase
LHPYLNIAIRAARAAAQIIVRSFDRLDTLIIREKAPLDYVTQIDKAAEKEIIYTVQQSYPDHAFLAEESGASSMDKGEQPLWIIDPLDGTLNFIHGLPHFCISIAILINNQIEHGVIYDPLRDELFTATRGHGARMNQKRIRVSSQESVQGSFLATGFVPYHPKEHKAVLKRLERLLPLATGIRRGGSAALDLAYIANGRFDGFWEVGLKPWDIAAGIVLVREAGGFLTTIDDREVDVLTAPSLLAASPRLHKNLLPILDLSES